MSCLIVEDYTALRTQVEKLRSEMPKALHAPSLTVRRGEQTTQQTS